MRKAFLISRIVICKILALKRPLVMTDKYQDGKSQSARVRKDVVIQVDAAQVKEGSRSLRIDSKQPSDVNVSQELFLPVGSTWKASVWIKGAAADSKLDDDQRGALEIETPAGNQGKASSPAGTFSWQREEINFRVPSPGRIRVALLSNYSGSLWFDDVRLEPLTLSQATDVYIKNSRLSQRQIDLKQGGQFIEPLCPHDPLYARSAG